eukprot:GGOE01005980.1.p1 GENE.GGOE01005980.1~~GGOE01005980.1.p1  ORF type:complete len:332 (-),score=1.51 GGOE01005980.1:266-1261(-)
MLVEFPWHKVLLVVPFFVLLIVTLLSPWQSNPIQAGVAQGLNTTLPMAQTDVNVSHQSYGCAQIATLPRIKLLGHGCISFAYESKIRAAVAVLKVPNLEYNCAPLNVRIHQFKNLLKWAKLGVSHPYLMPIIGHCEDKGNQGILVPFQRPVDPWGFRNASLQSRISAMLDLAQLLDAMTDKYILCDLRQDQFGLVNGHYVYQDLDMIYSLTTSGPGLPSPAGTRCTTSKGKFCTNTKCNARKRCPYPCLYSVVHDDIQELSCAPGKGCPGVGSPAMMYVFVRRFLRPYLGDVNDPELSIFIQSGLRRNPSHRPLAREAVSLLRALQRRTAT